ncbi:MAG: hypothetical protein AABY22_11255 [Nanoarchaeota archaeon]
MKPRLYLDIGEVDALIDWKIFIIQCNKQNGVYKADKYLKKNEKRLKQLIRIKNIHWPK